VAAALSGIGFAVTLQQDPDRRALLGGLSSFATTLAEGDEVVVFFAGHGIEMAGRNYLLAAEVPALRTGDEPFLAGEGIAIDLVMDTIRARKVRIATYILDACRDNPFAAQGTRSPGGARGLAVPPAVEGTFVIYSARPQARPRSTGCPMQTPIQTRSLPVCCCHSSRRPRFPSPILRSRHGRKCVGSPQPSDMPREFPSTTN
jgi:uncharacterized caspase-like protein